MYVLCYQAVTKQRLTSGWDLKIYAKKNLFISIVHKLLQQKVEAKSVKVLLD